jgi:hypothetical protein
MREWAGQTRGGRLRAQAGPEGVPRAQQGAAARVQAGEEREFHRSRSNDCSFRTNFIGGTHGRMSGANQRLQISRRHGKGGRACGPTTTCAGAAKVTSIGSSGLHRAEISPRVRSGNGEHHGETTHP